MRRKANEFKDFVKVDFHVHSPVSFDYKDKHQPEAWRAWLRHCVASECKVIAITDHNTFKGYFDAQQAVEQLYTELQSLERYRDKFPTLEQDEGFQDLSRIVLGLRDLWFIPGIEVETYDGIHMLAMFPSSIKATELKGFLSTIGINESDEGQSTAVEVTTLDLYRIVQELGGLVIAAHIDSHKGLHSEVGGGTRRAKLFKHDGLYGVQYSNEKVAESIRSALLSQPQYARESQLAFMQFSDFHNKSGELIGDPNTWLRIAQPQRMEKDFELLKTSLRNPDECVSSPAPPEVKDMLKRLLDSPDVSCLDVDDGSLKSDSDVELELSRTIASLVNSGPKDQNRIILGVTQRKTMVGVKRDASQVDSLMEAALQRIEVAGPLYKPRPLLRVYPFSGKCIVSVTVAKRPDALCAVDGKVMVLRAGVVAEANSREIKQMVESALVEKYKLLTSTQEKKIANAISTLQKATGYIATLKIARKVDDVSNRGSTLYTVSSPSAQRSSIIDVPENSNGLPAGEGNLGFVSPSPPRQEKAYFRLQLPIYEVDPSKIEGLSDCSERAIIVTMSCTAYWVPQKVSLGHPRKFFVILNVSEAEQMISAKVILGYLKSSLFLWYVSVHHDTLQFEDPLRFLQMLTGLPFPLLNRAQQRRVEHVVDEILKLEQQSLKAWAADGLPSSELSFSIKRHNTAVGHLLNQLDRVFYAACDLTLEEIEVVRATIKSIGLWVPPEDAPASQSSLTG